MRDEWGPVDPDEIDLIEPDVGVFGAPAEGGGEAGAGEAAPHKRARWMVPTAVAAVLAVGAAGAVAVWQPWADDGSVQLDGGSTSDDEPTLSERLVIGALADELQTGTRSDVETSGIFDSGTVGYIFSAPGAHIDFSGDSGRWAAFLAAPEDTDDISMPEDTPLTIQGAPGGFDENDGSNQGLDLTFGPVGGKLINVVGVGLTKAEILALAEVIRIDGDAITITDGAALADLEPIGPIDVYAAVLTVTLTVAGGGFAPGGSTMLCYGPAGTTCLAHADSLGEETMAMAKFFFSAGNPTEVHGQPAFFADLDLGEAAFGDAALGDQRHLVWVEGGRLLVVSGDVEDDELLALAESVRVATDEEWDIAEELIAENPVLDF